jgi:S-DNA-T family DNA segregation ATPase FtsK/SpoIIIE
MATDRKKKTPTPKKATSRRKTSTGQGALLTLDQRRDLSAVLLFAVAVFVSASLVPVDWFGARGAEWFPSGNLVGLIGGLVSGLLVSATGLAAPVVPVLIVLTGLGVGQWLAAARLWRGMALSIGALVIVPVAAFTLTGEAEIAGAIGRGLGTPFVGAFGVLGTLLLLGVATVVLMVATLGWNPLRTIGRGVWAAALWLFEALGKLARATLGLWQDSAERRRHAAAEAAARRPIAVEADDGAEWTGPETGELPDAADASSVEAQPTSAAVLDETRTGETGADDVEPEVDEADAAAVAAPQAPAVPATATAPTPMHDLLLPDPADPRDLVGGALPPLELLEPEAAADRAEMERELEELGQVLVERLKTFNVDCTLGGRTTGPVVTQFEVVPAAGVKVNRIANLDADLALAMKAQSIRIVAPIPGKGAVGVEIPNPHSSMVRLRAILEAKEFGHARGVLPLALGKDLTGRPYVADLAKMPHLLIAGATGSGKSVCINTVITSLVYRHTPETLRLLMIDPKMVELSAYADLPHLRHPVITDPADAAGVLKWAVLEMERRYQLLSANGTRSLGEFNKRVRDGVMLRRPDANGAEGDADRWIYDGGPLPYIVVVVDELADLMMQVQSEVERPLAQLAQKARAIGIHLIVATQRPTVNVITGLIKANFPTRIAFRVASKGDSRTILDMNGAEALLGNGDMLFLPPGQSEPVRLQGAFLDTDETDAILQWYREEQSRRDEEREAEGRPRPVAEPDIFEELRTHEMVEASAGVDEISGDWDELFRAAAEVCIQNQGGSTSLLQRKLSIGYGRAARIVDQLHDAGVLGPPDGSKPREVLMSLSDLDQMFGMGA